MSKQITISVPDKLHEKMEKWRNFFNFSAVFQEAISAKIEKRENFKKRITEGGNMEKVIERLKEEKVEYEQGMFEKGKLDAISFIKQSSYEDIQYALKHVTINECEVVGVDAWCGLQDEILGDYFCDIMKEYHLGYEDDGTPDERFYTWEEGWSEGLHECWTEIEDKI